MSMRWADADSSSDDEAPQAKAPVEDFQENVITSLNDASIPGIAGQAPPPPVSSSTSQRKGAAPKAGMTAWYSDSDDDDDDDEEGDGDEEDESDESEKEEDSPQANVETPSAKGSDVVEKKPSIVAKPLSKKERAALKAKELEDLDDIFNEFGIDAAAKTEEVAEEDEPVQNGETEGAEEGGAGEGKAKKKKKKKKKGGGDSSEATNGGATEGPVVKDVAAVLKAKKTIKEKTPAEIAAEKAAKEAKKKAEAEKKKKKKKKDKYAHGAPTR